LAAAFPSLQQAWPAEADAAPSAGLHEKCKTTEKRGTWLRPGRRQAGGGDGDDLGEASSDPGRRGAQQ